VVWLAGAARGCSQGTMHALGGRTPNMLLIFYMVSVHFLLHCLTSQQDSAGVDAASLGAIDSGVHTLHLFLPTGWVGGHTSPVAAYCAGLGGRG
jgi:hypothetical protein